MKRRLTLGLLTIFALTAVLSVAQCITAVVVYGQCRRCLQSALAFHGVLLARLQDTCQNTLLTGREQILQLHTNATVFKNELEHAAENANELSKACASGDLRWFKGLFKGEDQ
jgi:hypothetical protein